MKQAFLDPDEYTTFKEDTVYNQKDANGYIRFNACESIIVNLMRQGN
jgi:hypothetical protein